MRYRDLKQERDEAIARAIEAERLSMKSEVDRIKTESDARIEARCKRLAHIADHAAAASRKVSEAMLKLEGAAHEFNQAFPGP
jgi:hypothetical protein